MQSDLKRGTIGITPKGPYGQISLALLLDADCHNAYVCNLTGKYTDCGLFGKVRRAEFRTEPDYASVTLMKCGSEIVPVYKLYGNQVRVLEGFKHAGVWETTNTEPVFFELETPVRVFVDKYKDLLDEYFPSLLVDIITHEPLKDAVQVCDDTFTPTSQFVVSRSSLVSLVQATICDSFCEGGKCLLPTIEAINCHFQKHSIRHPIENKIMLNAHATEVPQYMKNAIDAHSSTTPTESSRKAGDSLSDFVRNFWIEKDNGSSDFRDSYSPTSPEYVGPSDTYSPTSPEYVPSSPEPREGGGRRVRPRHA